MTTPQGLHRRALMSSLVGLSVGGSTAVRGAGSDERPGRSAVLVAYFSRTGNTRVVAGLLHRALGAELFDIEPAVSYPEEYLATVERARQERDQAIEPALKLKAPGISDCRTLLLGFPIWGETAPPIIRSFLSAHDLSGKTLIPFITHGGYGLGDSLKVIARHAPGAVVKAGFVMQGEQERQFMDRVNGWLRGAPIAR